MIASESLAAVSAGVLGGPTTASHAVAPVQANKSRGLSRSNDWNVYLRVPLVVEQGMSTKQAECLDKFGKGGGLVDGKLVREFPVCRNSAN